MTPTAAPWTVTVLDQAVFIHGGPDNDDIADFSFADKYTVSISKDEAIANATLCAAAPDLLDALQYIVDTYGFDPSVDSAIWQTAHAALAKATVKP